MRFSHVLLYDCVYVGGGGGDDNHQRHFPRSQSDWKCCLSPPKKTNGGNHLQIARGFLNPAINGDSVMMEQEEKLRRRRSGGAASLRLSGKCDVMQDDGRCCSRYTCSSLDRQKFLLLHLLFPSSSSSSSSGSSLINVQRGWGVCMGYVG